MQTVTIFTEDFAGMKSQAVGFATRAGFLHDFCYLSPKAPWKYISAPYWPFPLRAVHPFQSRQADPVHISVGSVGGVINARLRSFHSKQKDKEHIAIHIQNPRIALDRFDLVIANPHDEIAGRNVLISRTALHPLSPEIFAEHKRKWLFRLKRNDNPLVSVLIGGNNGRFTLNRASAEILANQLKQLMLDQPINLALTPSRRTDPEALQCLKDHLLPLGAYIWDGTGDNPYIGLLSCADFILATVDSVSMVSEAVATTAPVMILPLPGKSRRIFSFIESLKQENRVRMFKGKLERWAVNALDDTDEIIHQARKRLKF